MAIINGRGRVGVRRTSAALSIVTSGLQLHLDAGNTASYPGTGTTWYDISGNGYNATLNNGSTYHSASKSILFDGTNQHAIVPYGSLIPRGTQKRTVCIWFKYTRAGGSLNDNIFGMGANNGNGSRLGMGIFSNKLGIESYGNGKQTTSWSGVNNWVHFCTVMNDNASYQTVDMYINGVLSTNTVSFGSASTTINNPATEIKIAGIPTYIYQYFYKGYISKIQIYNRNLSSSEILQNFNVQKSIYGL